jgi:hypothetical protein
MAGFRESGRHRASASAGAHYEIFAGGGWMCSGQSHVETRTGTNSLIDRDSKPGFTVNALGKTPVSGLVACHYTPDQIAQAAKDSLPVGS